MKKIFEKSLKIIGLMEQEQVAVMEFIQYNISYFSDIPLSSLIAPECRNCNDYKESSYIFLIGSYIYFSIYHNPVTWFERRRFAVFKDAEYEELFRKTLCCNVNNRFDCISDLKEKIENFLK